MQEISYVEERPWNKLLSSLWPRQYCHHNQGYRGRCWGDIQKSASWLFHVKTTLEIPVHIFVEKLRIFNSNVKSVLLYGSKKWRLTKTDLHFVRTISWNFHIVSYHLDLARREKIRSGEIRWQEFKRTSFTCNVHISLFSRRCTSSDQGISRIYGKQIVR